MCFETPATPLARAPPSAPLKSMPPAPGSVPMTATSASANTHYQQPSHLMRDGSIYERQYHPMMTYENNHLMNSLPVNYNSLNPGTSMPSAGFMEASPHPQMNQQMNPLDELISSLDSADRVGGNNFKFPQMNLREQFNPNSLLNFK